jgi:hypothetical protein
VRVVTRSRLEQLPTDKELRALRRAAKRGKHLELSRIDKEALRIAEEASRAFQQELTGGSTAQGATASSSSTAWTLGKGADLEHPGPHQSQQTAVLVPSGELEGPGAFHQELIGRSVTAEGSASASFIQLWSWERGLTLSTQDLTNWSNQEHWYPLDS